MESTPVGYAGNDSFEQRHKKLRKFSRKGKRPAAAVRTVLPKNKGRKGRTYAAVFRDSSAKTAGGLTHSHIKRVYVGVDSSGKKRYRYVSKARSEAARRAYSRKDSPINLWNKAVKNVVGSIQVISKSHPKYDEVRAEYRSLK
jgi:hypothetical protein